MLDNVFVKNEIISVYKKVPKLGERYVTPSIAGGKQKEKVVKEDVPAKPRSQRKLKRKAMVSVVYEEDGDNTVNDLHLEDDTINEDTMRSSNPHTS
ncbi:unnamed protein product [Lactuca virosa]|uniref:Uncharacterized protein n=1 Tax=Lactuca virosa TaxID=75947 RepID=A0AAU9MJF8_9ASTR|nr:unnamed protein product [Lactuca virosa]